MAKYIYPMYNMYNEFSRQLSKVLTIPPYDKAEEDCLVICTKLNHCYIDNEYLDNINDVIIRIRGCDS